MLPLTFRTKLLLALMGVVIAVTGAMLAMTHRSVTAGYEQLLRSEFERQLDYHLALQAERLQDLKELGAELAAWAQAASRTDTNFLRSLQPSSVDPSFSNQRGRFRELPSVLSTNNHFLELLRRVGLDPRRGFSRGPAIGPGGGMPQGPRLRRGGFLAVLDAAGTPILTLPPDREQLLGSAGSDAAQRRFAFVRSVLRAPDLQQIGCAPLLAATNLPAFEAQDLLRPTLRPGGATNEVLYEIVFNKVLGGAETNLLLGAFVVGVPMPDLLQRSPSRAVTGSTNQPVPPFLSGMWVGDDFYADPDDVPPALATTLSRHLETELAAGPRAEGEFVLETGGHSFWVFARLLNPDSRFAPAYHVCLYSLDQAAADWRTLRHWMLAAGGLALVLALILSWLIAHTLSVPLRELVAGTEDICRGDFAVRVPVRSCDELGQLARSFNQMADGLVQKERYRTVLNMVADEKVAQRLLDGGLTLGGEERQVTVLFCDIRGFTAYTQHMAPAAVIDMLNEHMTALSRVVKAHHGVLDKFVGDLLMALFGAPLAHENDPLNAVRCALALVAERTRLNGTSAHQLQVGLGLATGRVVAGCMGSTERLNYTVLGERVNLASRLCDIAAPGEVLIDDATRSLLGPLVTVTSQATVSLEGFAEPVPAWRLVAVKVKGTGEPVRSEPPP